MFKILLSVFCLAIVAVNAAPASPEKEKIHEVVPILSSEFTKSEDGSYDVHYETGDGSSRNEKSTIIDGGTDDETLEVKGSYKYLNDEGQEVEVFYTAGVNGFVPYGSIINPEISAVAEAAKDLPNLPQEEEPVAKKSQ